MRVFLAFTAAFGLSGCKLIEDATNSVLNDGTVVGVANCVESNRNNLVDDVVIRNSCARDFQFGISSFEVNGRARVSWRGDFQFSANLTNRHPDLLVSEISFILGYFDEEGESRTMRQTTFAWIAPRTTETLDLTFDVEWPRSTEPSFCGDDQTTNCVSYWQAAEIMGLRLH